VFKWLNRRSQRRSFSWEQFLGDFGSGISDFGLQCSRLRNRGASQQYRRMYPIARTGNTRSTDVSNNFLSEKRPVGPKVPCAISVTQTVYNAPAVWPINRKVSSREEPVVGNPQVRFREGH
jgi:hypothetical protein